MNSICIGKGQYLNNVYKVSINFCQKLSFGINQWNKELSVALKLQIEDHWKAKINENVINNNINEQNKHFVLSMFPYPSGKLHMGHVRVYTISDSIARCCRMKGKKVIHPMGWDAFGLPAENASIEHNVAPKKWTHDNIANMKVQLQQLGCSFDWSREVATCNPEYYRWTQHLFLQMYHKDLVYQKVSLVNWDPVDQTVLADEQVDSNGCSWRSGAKVEKRPLKQWFIRTTRFAKSLLDGLDDPILENWRDIIKVQKNWIGECNGVLFDFPLKDNDNNVLTVWTQFPEYIEYCSFIAIPPKSLLGMEYKSNKTPQFVINPFTNEEIQIIVTDEVEYSDGMDSYVGIPVSSEYDHEFATRYGFPIKYPQKRINTLAEKLNQQNAICQKAKSLNVGGDWTSSKLRDWLISRQRFWGTPIPIIHCTKCGPQPVSFENLPVILPDINKISLKGLSPLLEATDWLNTTCPSCGGHAKRETDTMDTFVDSSWYYLRYMDPNNNMQPFSREQAMQLAPVDLYIGGKEHAVLHLYYARFFHHFLHSLNLVPEREPFKKLLVQGMVNGRTYRLKGTGKYVKEHEVENIDFKKGKTIHKITKEPVVIAWEKMSKSKYNGVNPDDMFKNYSVDTTRLLILADVAPTSPRNWNSATFPGILNWQKRLWLTVGDFIKHRTHNPPMDTETLNYKTQEDKLFDSRNYYLKGVNFNIFTTQQLSVAISKMQGLTNTIRQSQPDVIVHGKQYERALATQLIMLAPLAPHFASELWSGFVSAPHRLNNNEIEWDKSVLEQRWPEVDLHYKCNLDFKINGMDIASYKLPRIELDQLTYSEAYRLAMSTEKIVDFIGERAILNIQFNLYKGCGAEIHIFTEHKTKQSTSISN